MSSTGIRVVEAAVTDYAGDYRATLDDLALRALDEEDSFAGAQRVFPAGYGQLTNGSPRACRFG